MNLYTQRLILRDWRDSDLDAFAALTADPEVMRHFPAVLDRAESDALAERLRARIAEDGIGFWAVERPGVADFIGFVGLSRIRFEAPFAGNVEIGWRLAREHWGQGLASEAARACLHFGFDTMDLPRIVSFTVPENQRSRRVMEKLGMRHEGEFDHPLLPAGHALRRHVLYGLANPAGS